MKMGASCFSLSVDQTDAETSSAKLKVDVPH